MERETIFYYKCIPLFRFLLFLGPPYKIYCPITFGSKIFPIKLKHN